MKFLCNHPLTRVALQKWAGQSKLAVASFFFWIAGTKMQKSQEGLLQSLLYEVLRQRPDLIPTVCPTRWNTKSDSYLDSWTRTDLFEALERLIHQDITSLKFCFFIDGLDEYNGDHFEMIEILKHFSTASNIKLCLWSRPWEVFKDAFDRDIDQRLYLQDLTRNDIKLYVRSKLEENRAFSAG